MLRISWLMTAVVLTVMPLSACGGPAGNESSNDEHNRGSTGLTLDGGNKWQADQHTRESMKDIGEALATMPTGTVGEMRALGTDLNVRVKDLVSGCTMSGEPHNQLHVFLEGFMPAATLRLRSP